MGNKPHHSGSIGGGKNLSNAKTPHNSLMKYMPIDDKASSLFKMGKPYSMGASMRGPLDKHGKHSNSGIYKMKQGPLNQARPDYIDIDGDGDKKESMKQAAAQKGPEMKGPLNKKCPDGKAWDPLRKGCFKSKKEESKMKMKMEKKIETKKQKQ